MSSESGVDDLPPVAASSNEAGEAGAKDAESASSSNGVPEKPESNDPVSKQADTNASESPTSSSPTSENGEGAPGLPGGEAPPSTRAADGDDAGPEAAKAESESGEAKPESDTGEPKPESDTGEPKPESDAGGEEEEKNDATDSVPEPLPTSDDAASQSADVDVGDASKDGVDADAAKDVADTDADVASKDGVDTGAGVDDAAKDVADTSGDASASSELREFLKGLSVEDKLDGFISAGYTNLQTLYDMDEKSRRVALRSIGLVAFGVRNRLEKALLERFAPPAPPTEDTDAVDAKRTPKSSKKRSRSKKKGKTPKRSAKKRLTLSPKPKKSPKKVAKKRTPSPKKKVTKKKRAPVPKEETDDSDVEMEPIDDEEEDDPLELKEDPGEDEEDFDPAEDVGEEEEIDIPQEVVDNDMEDDDYDEFMSTKSPLRKKTKSAKKSASKRSRRSSGGSRRRSTPKAKESTAFAGDVFASAQKGGGRRRKSASAAKKQRRRSARRNSGEADAAAAKPGRRKSSEMSDFMRVASSVGNDADSDSDDGDTEGLFGGIKFLMVGFAESEMSQEARRSKKKGKDDDLADPDKLRALIEDNGGRVKEDPDTRGRVDYAIFPVADVEAGTDADIRHYQRQGVTVVSSKFVRDCVARDELLTSDVDKYCPPKPRGKIFEGLNFSYEGKPPLPKATLDDIIEDNGGKLRRGITRDLTYLLTRPDCVEKQTKKVREAIDRCVAVVDFDWVLRCASAHRRLKILDKWRLYDADEDEDTAEEDGPAQRVRLERSRESGSSPLKAAVTHFCVLLLDRRKCIVTTGVDGKGSEKTKTSEFRTYARAKQEFETILARKLKVGFKEVEAREDEDEDGDKENDAGGNASKQPEADAKEAEVEEAPDKSGKDEVEDEDAAEDEDGEASSSTPSPAPEAETDDTVEKGGSADDAEVEESEDVDIDMTEVSGEKQDAENEKSVEDTDMADASEKEIGAEEQSGDDGDGDDAMEDVGDEEEVSKEESGVGEDAEEPSVESVKGSSEQKSPAAAEEVSEDIVEEDGRSASEAADVADVLPEESGAEEEENEEGEPDVEKSEGAEEEDHPIDESEKTKDGEEIKEEHLVQNTDHSDNSVPKESSEEEVSSESAKQVATEDAADIATAQSDENAAQPTRSSSPAEDDTKPSPSAPAETSEDAEPEEAVPPPKDEAAATGEKTKSSDVEAATGESLPEDVVDAFMEEVIPETPPDELRTDDAVANSVKAAAAGAKRSRTESTPNGADSGDIDQTDDPSPSKRRKLDSTELDNGANVDADVSMEANADGEPARGDAGAAAGSPPADGGAERKKRSRSPAGSPAADARSTTSTEATMGGDHGASTWCAETKSDANEAHSDAAEDRDAKRRKILDLGTDQATYRYIRLSMKSNKGHTKTYTLEQDGILLRTEYTVSGRPEKRKARTSSCQSEQESGGLFDETVSEKIRKGYVTMESSTDRAPTPRIITDDE